MTRTNTEILEDPTITILDYWGRSDLEDGRVEFNFRSPQAPGMGIDLRTRDETIEGYAAENIILATMVDDPDPVGVSVENIDGYFYFEVEYPNGIFISASEENPFDLQTWDKYYGDQRRWRENRERFLESRHSLGHFPRLKRGWNRLVVKVGLFLMSKLKVEVD